MGAWAHYKGVTALFGTRRLRSMDIHTKTQKCSISAHRAGGSPPAPKDAGLQTDDFDE